MICAKIPWHVHVSLTLLNSSEWRSLLCWLLQISIIPEACLAFKICTQLCFQSQPAPEWLLVTNTLTFKKLGIALRVRGDAHFNGPLSSACTNVSRRNGTAYDGRGEPWLSVDADSYFGKLRSECSRSCCKRAKMILGYAVGYVVKRKIHPKAHWAYFLRHVSKTGINCGLRT